MAANLITDVGGVRVGIGRRRAARLGRHRGTIRRTGGGVDCDQRRRARVARHRAVGAGNDHRARRWLRFVRRVGFRPRRGGWRDGLSCRDRTRLRASWRTRSDRAGREPVRSPQRRRQGLGPQAALLGDGLQGRLDRGAQFRARNRRRRIWRDDLRSQRGLRLRERRDLERLSRRRARGREFRRARDPRRKPALLGRALRARGGVRRSRLRPAAYRRPFDAPPQVRHALQHRPCCGRHRCGA